MNSREKHGGRRARQLIHLLGTAAVPRLSGAAWRTSARGLCRACITYLPVGRPALLPLRSTYVLELLLAVLRVARRCAALGRSEAAAAAEATDFGTALL